MAKGRRLRFIHDLLTRLNRDYTISGDYVIDHTPHSNRFATPLLISHSTFYRIDSEREQPDEGRHASYPYILSTEIELEETILNPIRSQEDQVERIYRTTEALERSFWRANLSSWSN